ncbi:hypothetical protein BGZ98_006761, partial [Dissophora globulifera]
SRIRMPRRCKSRPSRSFARPRRDKGSLSRSQSKRSMTTRNCWNTEGGSARSLRIVSNAVDFTLENGSSTPHGRKVRTSFK